MIKGKNHIQASDDKMIASKLASGFLSYTIQLTAIVTDSCDNFNQGDSKNQTEQLPC